MSVILKRAIAVVIVVVFVWGLVTMLYNIASYVTALLLVVLGAILAIISVLSDTKRHSPIKVGNINRGEFYGVIVVVVGCMFYLNTRIDSIYQIIVSLK